MFLYFFHQPLDLRDFGTISGYRVCFCARGFIRESVEGGDGFVAGRGFAGGDEDFGTACLEKTE
jgi:hypothetical protein